MDKCLRQLEQDFGAGGVKSAELSRLVLRQRVAMVARARLEMQLPYVAMWPTALSIQPPDGLMPACAELVAAAAPPQAKPANLPTSVSQRWQLLSAVWGLVGDQTAEGEYYVRRALLGGIYHATELYMLTDFSPAYRDTWMFLDRQIEGVLELRKAADEASHLVATIGAGLGSTLNGFIQRGQFPGSR
eukprot:SM000017S02821  [mRNA]  locus=s17:550355:551341:+ [translate_table: standard]